MPAIRLPHAAEFEHRVARDEGVSDRDIHLSRLSGMAPADIDVLCDFTREQGLLIVVRCPKRPARYFQGRFDPKPMDVKQKSDPATGLVTLPSGRVLVSDYDLMCVYRYLGGNDYERIPFTGTDATHPDILPAEAMALLARINPRLKSPFQHGAQDDYQSPRHPNVRVHQEGHAMPDRFMVFNLGRAEAVPTAADLAEVYRRHGLDWPYDADGRHRSAAR
jgi:hypothetical protein